MVNERSLTSVVGLAIGTGETRKDLEDNGSQAGHVKMSKGKLTALRKAEAAEAAKVNAALAAERDKKLKEKKAKKVELRQRVETLRTDPVQSEPTISKRKAFPDGADTSR
jgi:hypothetical protein